jgi:hypothetical protein
VTERFLNVRNAGVYIGGAVANVATLRGNTNTVIWYALFGLGHPIRVYMGGLNVTREASFEAKESDQSCHGIGGRWSVVAGRRRIQGSRWSGRRDTDGEDGTGNYSR